MSYIECFGSSLEELYAAGLTSLQTKLRSAGLPPERLPGVVPLPTDIPPQEQARRAIRLARAGVLGEKNGRPSSDAETMSMVFEAVALSVDRRHTPARAMTIQWEFTDAPTWHMRVDNGSTRVVPEAIDHPDLAFRCRWEDWIDVAMGREDPRLAVLKRKLKLRGSLPVLWRSREMFTT
jgi:putative sterol carrier protein